MSTHAAEPAKIWKKFRDGRFVMLTTLDEAGTPAACPMTMQQTEGETDLWIFTSDQTDTARHVQREPRVGVVSMDNGDSFYLSIAGTATLLHDRTKIKELWNPMVKAWFPQGPEDPHLALIRVQVERAEYWNNDSSKMVRFFEIAKAVATGTTPKNIGEHGELAR